LIRDKEDSSATGVNGNQHDEGINGAGAAYVFVRSGTNWSQQAYLKASNTGRHNWFGYAVAISGDTVVVGALGEGSNATGINGNQNNNTATDAGAVYVFVRSGTNWSQQAYLKASNTGAGDEFGSAVAISGDTLAVGAWAEDSNATGANGNQNSNSASNSGAAYVFVRNGTNWNQQAYLKASNTRTAAEFAGTVAISGDTLAVGAGAESSSATGVNGDQSDTNAPESGAAYVFVRAGTNWSQQAYLKASNAKAGDQFAKVAVSGDLVAVGAVSEPSKATGVNGDQTDHSAPIAGSAYVFVRTGTNWNQQAYLKPSNTRAYDEFSWSLAISGDTVVVGADGEFSNATGVNGDQSNTNAPVSGAAYVFTGLGPPMRTTITVTDTADDGPGTLRAALASAADGDTIDFSLLSTPATIALTSDELSVSNSVTILGPGPNALAVAADKSVFPRIRIFRICSNTVVNLSGLTITNGSARFDSGGGIFNDHATLTVSNCTLSGNHPERQRFQ